MNREFNSYKITDILDYEYTKTPKKLLHSKISPFARILCIAMLERLSLSIRNKWTDDDGNVYIIYTVKEAMELLGCSKPKAVSVFAELDGKFIKRKRQGLCKPDIIYINNNFDSEDSRNSCREGRECPDCRLVQNASDSIDYSFNPDTDLSTDNVENSNIEFPESKNETIQNSENNPSGTFNFKHQEVKDFNPNNINNNKNNINKNYIINPICQYIDGG